MRFSICSFLVGFCLIKSSFSQDTVQLKSLSDISIVGKNSKSAGKNNLFDARYFTRRSGGYPGPGLLPADGRTLFISVSFKG